MKIYQLARNPWKRLEKIYQHLEKNVESWSLKILQNA